MLEQDGLITRSKIDCKCPKCKKTWGKRYANLQDLRNHDYFVGLCRFCTEKL